jgi:hypothetical protein
MAEAAFSLKRFIEALQLYYTHTSCALNKNGLFLAD